MKKAKTILGFTPSIVCPVCHRGAVSVETSGKTQGYTHIAKGKTYRHWWVEVQGRAASEC